MQASATTDELVEYEGLPSTFSFSAHMTAGAIAGIAEHGLIYPLDSIKTRMQIFTSAGQQRPQVFTSSLLQTVKSVMSSEGVSGLFRGFGSIILGAGPSHAIYFAVYEESKALLEGYQHVISPVASYALSGAFATCLAEAFATPFDVLKQRMQIGFASLETCPVTAANCTNANIATTPSCPPLPVQGPEKLRYQSLSHCFKHTLRTEGVSAFFVSYPTTLAMAVPYQMLNFTTYELMRSLLHPLITSTSSTTSNSMSGDVHVTSSQNTSVYDPNAYSPLTHALSGGIAGAIAAGLTTPLDVSKTLLQTRGASTCPRIRASRTLWDAGRIIWAREGWRGFMRGSSARISSTVPAAGISWLTYEYFKWMLQGRDFFSSSSSSSLSGGSYGAKDGGQHDVKQKESRTSKQEMKV